MPKRRHDDEFPLGALIVTGDVAKRLWAAIEQDPNSKRITADAKEQLSFNKRFRGATQSYAEQPQEDEEDGVEEPAPEQPQDSEAFGDVGDLCNKLSLSLRGGTVDLTGTLLRGASCSSGAASKWRRTKMWPQPQQISFESVDTGLYSLVQAPSQTIISTVSGAGFTVEGGILALGENECIVLDASCSDASFCDVTIRGGTLVCHGGECSVTFARVNFEASTLVVMQAAQATLTDCNFSHNSEDPDGISIFAFGNGTSVQVERGTIVGGIQGAAVHRGASMNASNFHMTQCFVTGIEAKDSGSSLTLMQCTMSAFPHTLCDVADVDGVLVQQDALATLKECSWSSMQCGVCVQAGGAAIATGCSVADTQVSGYAVSGGGSADLTQCTASGAGIAGVFVYDKGTEVSLTGCTLSGCKTHGILVTNAGRGDIKDSTMKKNGDSGAFASDGGVVSLVNCSSVWNAKGGFWVESSASITVVDSKSVGDGDCGCGGYDGGRIEAERLDVSKAKKDGFLFQENSVALLRECTATACNSNGFNIQGAGTKVGIEAGEASSNKECGVSVHGGAEAALEHVRTSDHRKVGFKCTGRGSRLQLRSCESEDSNPYKFEKDGVLQCFDCRPARPGTGKKTRLLEALKVEFKR